MKLTDRSSNGCYLNDVKMTLHQPTTVHQGDTIVLLHKAKVARGQGIAFTLNSQITLKKQEEEEKEEIEDKEIEEKV